MLIFPKAFFLLLLLLSLLDSQEIFCYVAKKHFRKDISSSINKIVCSDLLRKKKNTYIRKIHDAFVIIEVIEAQAGENLTDSEVFTFIESQSDQQLYHHGYSWGRCNSFKAWFAFTPSPKPPLLNEKKIKFPIKTLKKYCRSWQVQFASYKGGQSKIVDFTENYLDLSSYRQGTLSLSCRPIENHDVGSILWFLFFLGDLPLKVPYQDQILEFSGSSHDKILLWINLVRQENGLSRSLAHEKDIFIYQKDDENLFSILHNLVYLREKQVKITEKFQILGENKVKGANLEEALKLLWFSPSHRNLILNHAADSVSLKIRQEVDLLFIALFFLRRY